eukprot:10627660-Ditylum_brightwellii.AAC.1
MSSLERKRGDLASSSVLPFMEDAVTCLDVLIKNSVENPWLHEMIMRSKKIVWLSWLSGIV